MFKQPSSVTFGPDCWPWVLDERKLWTLGGAGSHTQKKRRCKTNSPTLRKERALFGPLSDLQDPRPVRHPPLPERPSPTLSPSSSPGAHSVLAFIRLRKGSWTDLFSTYFYSNEGLDVSCLKPWPWILLTSKICWFTFKALFYFFLTFYFLWLHPDIHLSSQTGSPPSSSRLIVTWCCTDEAWGCFRMIRSCLTWIGN